MEGYQPQIKAEKFDCVPYTQMLAMRMASPPPGRRVRLMIAAARILQRRDALASPMGLPSEIPDVWLELLFTVFLFLSSSFLVAAATVAVAIVSPPSRIILVTIELNRAGDRISRDRNISERISLVDTCGGSRLD